MSPSRKIVLFLTVWVLGTSISGSPAVAQTAGATPGDQQVDHSGMDMSGMDMSGMKMPAGSTPKDMGKMQGGKAPTDARDSNAYSDGYRNSTLPNYEMADKLSIPKVQIDELEYLRGNEGSGVAWSGLITNGTDDNKLWIRSQGLKNARDQLDRETGTEVLWWHARSPFWGTVLGVRQDIGKGANTWLAAGIEGLAPYWFDIQLTGYVGTDGRLAARTRVSYDALLTNRLILTPQVEANLYSKQSVDRELGSGLSNLELSGRLRYEFSRKFAPYVGYVWERSFGGTARFRRVDGSTPGEYRFVAGVRMWW